jgi:hypothetical protein
MDLGIGPTIGELTGTVKITFQFLSVLKETVDLKKLSVLLFKYVKQKILRFRFFA